MIKKSGIIFISLVLIVILSAGTTIADYINWKTSVTTQTCTTNDKSKDRTDDSRRVVSLSLIEDLCHHVITDYLGSHFWNKLHIGLFYLKDDKHLRTFYPTIPTPPPNIA
jgi:hypothetical protein